MELLELKKEVKKLSPGDFNEFTSWLDECVAEQWDIQIQEDAAHGKLDFIDHKADAAAKSGNYTKL